ncbi:hypothetical protein P3L51_25000 [Streptomyces sp. PSRA5]|uniref:hypothetical protein n=1 Tax=Streptomyces panacea TaxID=3035064 RepID=UPI00339C8AB3
MAVLAGLGAWAFWPSGEPAVAVPDRVCGGALPGGPVRDLLPERGQGFEEDLSGSSSRNSVSTVWKCRLSAGGQSVYLTYSPILSPDDYGSEDIVRDAGKPGNVPLSWGTDRGFVEGDKVSLYVACDGSEGREILLDVSTSVNGADGELKDRATQDKAVALTARTARFVSARVDFCEPPSLPDGSPKIG